MTIWKIVMTTAAFLIVFAGAIFVALKVNEALGAAIVIVAVLVYIGYVGWQIDKGCSQVEDAGQREVMFEVTALTQRLYDRGRGGGGTE